MNTLTHKHSLLLTLLHLWLLTICYSQKKLLQVRNVYSNSPVRMHLKNISLLLLMHFIFLNGKGNSWAGESFFFSHSTQNSIFFYLVLFPMVACMCVCVCACRFPAVSFPPPSCALSLYHHIFPWQINFTHDQPTPLAALGPAVIKRREITIYIILMQTSFSR